jgi:hypothetical protein
MEASMRTLLVAAFTAAVSCSGVALAQSASIADGAGPSTQDAPLTALCPTSPDPTAAQACPATPNAGGPLALEVALPEISGAIAVIDVAASTIALRDGKVFAVPEDLGVTKLKVGEMVRIKFIEVDGKMTAKEIRTEHEG